LVYHYIAFNHTPGKVYIGSYTGDGNDNRIITSPGGGGSFVMVRKEGQHTLQRMWDMTNDKALYFKNTAAVSDRIQRNTVTGFEIGTNNEVNQLSSVYHYIQINGTGFTSLADKTITFSAEALNNNIQLNWSIPKQVIPQSFLVERSTNGLQFLSLVPIQPEQTSAGTKSSYSYTDKKPLNGYSYYRIKIIFPDNHAEYSDIKKVYTRALTDISVSFYNTYSLDRYIRVNYTGNEKKVWMNIYDLNGKKLLSHTLINGNNNFQIPSSVSKGSYLAVIGSDRGPIFNKIFVIQ
jgi:hypothetical protein